MAELAHSHSRESGAATLSSRPGGGSKFGREFILRVGPMPSNSVAAGFGGDHALNADFLESFRDTVKRFRNTLFFIPGINLKFSWVPGSPATPRRDVLCTRVPQPRSG